jgi:hypothetical protein
MGEPVQAQTVDEWKGLKKMDYKHKGYTFRKTTTTTTVYRKYFGSPFSTQATANLYEIVDLKERGKRPFLTSVKGCRDYIDEHGKG